MAQRRNMDSEQRREARLSHSATSLQHTCILFLRIRVKSEVGSPHNACISTSLDVVSHAHGASAQSIAHVAKKWRRSFRGSQASKEKVLVGLLSYFQIVTKVQVLVPQTSKLKER